MSVGDVVWVIAGLGFLGWVGSAPAGAWLRDRDPDEDDTDHPAGP